MSSITKACTKCKNEKDISFFGMDRGRIKSKCKQCASAYSGEWGKRNPERKRATNKASAERNIENVREARRKWRIKNLQKTASLQQARNSRKKGLQSGFSSSDWEDILSYFCGKCAYCGGGEKMTQDHFVSVLNGGGYIKGNIVPACGVCNSSKGSKDVFLWLCNRNGQDTGTEIYNKIRCYIDKC